MALQSLDIRPPLGHDHASRRRARARHRRGRQADRRIEVHRLQGVPGRLHGVERPARRDRHEHRHLRQPARPDASSRGR